MSDEKKIIPFPKGSIKTEHATLLLIDTKSTDVKCRAGWGIELTYKVSFGDQVETKTKTFPGGKYQDGGLKIPHNKKSWEGFNAVEGAGKKAAFTLTWLKGEEYWDVIDVELGHQGVQGVLKPDEQGGNTGGGASFDPTDALASLAITTAASIVTAGLTKKELVDTDSVLDKIQEVALELLPSLKGVKSSVIKALGPAPEIKEEGKAGTDGDISAGEDDPDGDDDFGEANNQEVDEFD